MTSTTAAAFVEMDHALVAGSAMLALARGLAVRGALSTKDLATMAWHNAVDGRAAFDGPEPGDWPLTGPDAGTGEPPYLWDASLDHLTGRRVEEIVRLTEDVFDEAVAVRVWPGTQTLLARHLAAGEQVWLLSSAPVDVARVFARELGLTGALGTVAETRHGRFTGRVVGRPLTGTARAAAVVDLAERVGLDLSRCTAYVHGIADLPLLRLVGHPVAVNPDPWLDRAARRSHWPRHDWRRRNRARALAASLRRRATSGQSAD